jgi:predicted ArsR family transcriptional regulator
LVVQKTQSQKLAELLKGGKTVTRAQMAKKLRVKQEMVSSYLAELVRVYGAKIQHEPRSTDYRLIGSVDVSVAGRVKRK